MRICCYKKSITSIIVFLFFGLSIIHSSGFQIDNKTVIQTSRGNTENISEPLWGGGGVVVCIKEIYGSPDNPQYQPLPNVTVKIWHTWFFF